MEGETTKVSSSSGSRKRARALLDVQEEKVVDGFIPKYSKKKKKLASKNGIWKELDLALSIESKDLKSLTYVLFDRSHQNLNLLFFSFLFGLILFNLMQ